MHYNTFKNETYAGGTITRNSERLVYCKITTDIHTSHSAEQSALELLYADALLAGAGTLNREQFINQLNMLGGSITVHLSSSTLTITLKVLKENLPKLLTLVETMLQSPQFVPNEIKRIKRQTHNELVEANEDARSLSAQHMVNELFVKKDRRFSENPDTIRKMLPQVTRKALQAFHKKVLGSFWYVTIGGDKNTVTKILQSVEKAKKNVTIHQASRKEHAQKEVTTKLLLHNIPSKQNIEFSIGGNLPMTLHHPHYVPFVFGLSVLGKWGGFTGRLMSTVREKEGLTYGIYARTETVSGTEQGYWRIMTFFSPQQALQGLQSTIREIALIQTKGVTTAEFTRFKEILKTQQILLGDSLTSSVDELHGYICENFDLIEMSAFKQRLHTVTLAEVNKAIKTHLRTDALVISGAGPVTAVKKELQRFVNKVT